MLQELVNQKSAARHLPRHLVVAAGCSAASSIVALNCLLEEDREWIGFWIVRRFYDEGFELILREAISDFGGFGNKECVKGAIGILGRRTAF